MTVPTSGATGSLSNEQSLIIVAFFALGIAYGTQIEEWSVVDSLYWIIVTITTVGYGDYSPVAAQGLYKYAACVWIIFGVVFIMDIVQKVIHDAQDSMKEAMNKEHDECDDETMKSFKAKYPTASLGKLAAVLAIGTIFFAHNEGWNYEDALYWCVCTASTVGYGDLSLSNDTSRIVSIFYVLVSIAAFGGVLGELQEITIRTKWDYNQEKVRSLKLSADLIRKTDVDNSGSVTEGEFLAACLGEMGIVSVKDCNFFLEKFKQLDADGSGSLNEEDLRGMTEEVKDFQNSHEGMEQRLGSFRSGTSGGGVIQGATDSGGGLGLVSVKGSSSMVGKTAFAASML
jgi:hypothetical protein